MEKKLTAVQWIYQISKQREPDKFDWEIAKQMEESQIKDAIMYSLDEDGHTGEWKIKFADNYIKKLKDGEAIRK